MIYDGVKHFAGFLDRNEQELMVSALREVVLAVAKAPCSFRLCRARAGRSAYA